VLHFPLLQYRRPEPVETGIVFQTSPPLRMIITWRAMLTSRLTEPVARGLLGSIGPPDFGFFVVGAAVGGTVAATVVGGTVVSAIVVVGCGAAVVGGVVVGGAVVTGAAVVGATVVDAGGTMNGSTLWASAGMAKATLANASAVAVIARLRRRRFWRRWMG
jgi:hypothetical protein